MSGLISNKWFLRMFGRVSRSRPMASVRTSLADQIRHAPLFRHVATESDLKRKVAIVCYPKDSEKAIQWFSELTNRLPEYIHFCDKPVPDKLPVPLISVASLAESLEILPLVYDEGDPRRKGIYLSLSGVIYYAFHRDPGYGHFRTDHACYSVHQAELEKLWASLEDQESRLTLASIVKSRLTGNCGYLRIAPYQEYSHPMVKARQGDTVADCGSFDGKTSIEFAKEVGEAGKVYAFEPAPKNLSRIKRNLKEQEIHNVVVVSKAVSSGSGKVRFNAGDGGSSRISDDGEGIEVTTISLDQFSRRHGNLKIDLISLDVEGAEPDVLLGSHGLIGKQRPKVQISIYHDKRHLFEIPLLFLATYPDYVLYLGHHNTYSTETDAYLIPRERLGK